MMNEDISVEIGTILPYVTVYYEPNPPKFRIRFKYHWVYAHTMEEAEKLSAEAKTQRYPAKTNK